ncbi:acyl-CoA-binding domain-containing protein 6-like [Coccinella septempunctata]|uniref:acyl-CoA-binding domain-containing protein 6-like n=1 Tax=Coccinella septempunctata TaxID=41139 RepID=UPI001D063BDE|nr:acyl-CoA-binding domain-containing protein 6-like [Coccinella septempunctata]
MAEFVDNFSDLKELGIDPNLSELDENFEQAANHLPMLVSSLSEETLLTLYGYYKQGKDGICNIPKPSWFDFKGRAKWEAWKKLGDMSEEEAKVLYIDTILEIDPSFELNTKKESWIAVSTLQNEEADTQDKSLVDFVKENDREMVLFFLKKMEPEKINKLDENGLSLIHWASDRGSVEIISDLLSHGADINLKDSEGQTALHYSASCGHIDCVRLLLEKGALRNIEDDEGLTPLDVANDENIKLLLACS